MAYENIYLVLDLFLDPAETDLEKLKTEIRKKINLWNRNPTAFPHQLQVANEFLNRNDSKEILKSQAQAAFTVREKDGKEKAASYEEDGLLEPKEVEEQVKEFERYFKKNTILSWFTLEIDDGEEKEEEYIFEIPNEPNYGIKITAPGEMRKIDDELKMVLGRDGGTLYDLLGLSKSAELGNLQTRAKQGYDESFKDQNKGKNARVDAKISALGRAMRIFKDHESRKGYDIALLHRPFYQLVEKRFKGRSFKGWVAVSEYNRSITEAREAGLNKEDAEWLVYDYYINKRGCPIPKLTKDDKIIIAQEEAKLAGEKAKKTSQQAEEKARKAAQQAEENARKTAQQEIDVMRRKAEVDAKRAAQQAEANAKRVAQQEIDAIKQRADAEMNSMREKMKRNSTIKSVATIVVVFLLIGLGLAILVTVGPQIMEKYQEHTAKVADNKERILLQEEEKRIAEEERKAEEERRAEEKRITEEKQAEQKRIADEKRRTDERRLAEEKRIAEEKRRDEEKRLAEEKRTAEQKRIADEKQAEEKRIAEEKRKAEEELDARLKPILAQAVDLNEELKKNGFSNLRDANGRFERLKDFVGYGSVQLKNNWEKIRYNTRATDATKDKVKMNIRTAQTDIAEKVFVADYPFTISTFSYRDGAEMGVSTGFKVSRLERIAFPLPDLTGKIGNSYSDKLTLTLSGSKDSIEKLDRYKNECLARVWFKNLRADDDYAISISADIVKIAIVRKKSQTTQSRPQSRQ